MFWRFWWCLYGISVVSRWCLAGVRAVSVMSWWCLDGVSVVVSVASRWRLGCVGGVSVVSVVSWCFGGASMMSRWCLGGVLAASMLIQGVHGVLVVSWWRRVGRVKNVM